MEWKKHEDRDPVPAMSPRDESHPRMESWKFTQGRCPVSSSSLWGLQHGVRVCTMWSTSHNWCPLKNRL